MNRTSYYFVMSLLLLSYACSSEKLNQALELAGNNRVEMEKVLAHFQRQGGKSYKSACFIIENMPYHKSRVQIALDPSYNSFFLKTDSIYNEIFGEMCPLEVLQAKPKKYDSLRLELARIFEVLIPPKLLHIDEYDITTVSSGFLIKNIEDALLMWEKSPYLRDMSFDEFKEFVLPYRTTNENIMLDKVAIRDLYEDVILSHEALTIKESLDNYKAYVAKCRWINKHLRPKEHCGIYDLFIPKFKMDCHNMTNWSNNILRSCGVPVVYEFTPQWTERTQKHFWCVSPDSTGIWKPYTAPDNNLMEDWDSDIKYAGKVYRRTFEAHKNTPFFMAQENEDIPECFNTPLLQDYTWRYHQTVTLRLPLAERIVNNVVYLCMDRQGELNPVGWGLVDHEKNSVVFEQVPLNVLFFPACFDGGKIIQISEPFMLHAANRIQEIPLPLTENIPPNKPLDITVENQKNYLTGNKNKTVEEISYLSLKCDNSKKISMKLLRKFPEKRRFKELQMKLKGAVFLGSDEENGNFDTLYTLNYIPYPYLQEIVIDFPRKYRYYRFATHDRGPVNIAHMEFLGPKSLSHQCTPATPLPVFSVDEKLSHNELCRVMGIPLKTGSKPEVAFDGDYLSFAGSSSIGMDFGTPVEITHIRFIPRNANNGINERNSYSLMYYDHGWKHFATQYADKNFLIFENVPKASLFWLRNLTEGVEEQPFFYINGKQLFLHADTIKKYMLSL
ncbi:MAG: hypothetical protein LRY59_03440 [Bacteroides graminisolvens]|nr:hypothetical protein [Bacteroides graminisolvens]